MVKLSIVILSFNTKDLTIRCIKSIADQYKKQLEKGEFEIIIVDNASTDGSVEAFQSASWRTKIKIIKNTENVGFSKGNNIGAKNAKGKYLFFLNSDTEILDDEFWGMINFLEENPQVGILGARLINIDGSNQKSVGKFYGLRNVFLMLLGGERLGLLRFAPKDIVNTDWVSGAALMIRKDLFEKLNGFDEEIFMYMEDMELCFRAKKLGSLVGFYPKIKILHKERGSSNRRYAIVSIYKSLIYFYQKHKNHLELFLVKIMLAIKAILAIFLGILINSSYLKNTYKTALKLV